MDIDERLREALAGLRRARISADKVLADFDAQVGELRRRWDTELKGGADLDVWMFGDPHETAEQERLLDPADREAFERLRLAADELRADVYNRFTPIVEPARAELRRQLEDWISSTPMEIAREQWSVVLSTWRSSVGATVREAGEALGVNPSSIVRYERGTGLPGGRLPGAPQLRSLVEKLAEAPVSRGPWDNDDRVTRAMTELFGVDRNEYTGFVDASLVNTTIVIDGVQNAVQGLSRRQLSILAAVVQHPTGLSDLLSLAEELVSGAADAVRERALEGITREQGSTRALEPAVSKKERT